jgi:hypothetical protein
MALTEGTVKILDFLKQHSAIGLPGVNRQVNKPMALRISCLY